MGSAELPSPASWAHRELRQSVLLDFLKLCYGFYSSLVLSVQLLASLSLICNLSFSFYTYKMQRNLVGEMLAWKSLQPPPEFCYCCSVDKSCLTLRPHGLQHTRFPCLSLSSSTQTYWWSHSAISSHSSHPLSPSSPPALSLAQHQGFFQWVGSSHQVAKILELQLQHQSFQWIPCNYLTLI